MFQVIGSLAHSDMCYASHEKCFVKIKINLKKYMTIEKSNINLNFSETESPKISEDLSSLTEELRMEKLSEILRALNARSFSIDWFEIVRWEPANQITVSLNKQDSAAVRGPNLLKLESLLKRIVDPAIEVYLEAKEDKNKLRSFRGVQIAKQ